MTGAERPVCACCGMVINYMLRTTDRLDEPEFVWVHGALKTTTRCSPHPLNHQRYCDFCSAANPGWAIDTDQDQRLRAARSGVHNGRFVTGRWALSVC